MEERTKVVIYARVSTSAQDYTRQITELRKYAKKQNYEIVKEFSEKISGAKKIEERAAAKGAVLATPTEAPNSLTEGWGPIQMMSSTV